MRAASLEAKVLGPAREGQVVLPRRERDSVEAVDGLTVVLPRPGDLLDRLGEQAGVVEADMAERDVRRHPLERDPEAGRVAEAAVGVGERVEQVVAGTCRDDLARPGEDIHLEHGLVRQSVAEAGRLDAEPGDRAPERDGAQLRHHLRHESVREGRIDEVLVGAHALDVGCRRAADRRVGMRVDLDDTGQPAHVEAGRGARGARAEQVGRLLRQPDRITRRDG